MAAAVEAPRDGRQAVSPARLATVSVLQFLLGLSDRQAAEAVRCRIDFKCAFSLELDDPGFPRNVRGHGPATVPPVTTQLPSSSLDPAPIVDREDLKVIRREFSLGEVHGLVFLPNGVLNRNWRIQTGNGDFALKLLHRADAEPVSRSARVLTAPARLGLPVPAWVPTRSGEPLLQIGPRTYGLSHWAERTHLPGHQLSLEQAAEF